VSPCPIAIDAHELLSLSQDFVSHSTQNTSFRRRSFHASTDETEPNTTKANIRSERKNTTTENKQKLKPGLVFLYDLWPGDRAGPILRLPGPTWSPADYI